MNPIILPKKILNKDVDYLIQIYNSNINHFDYKIDNRDINNILKKIKENNNYYNSNQIQKNLLYVIIKLFETNDIDNPLSTLDGGIPNNGIEFINKKTYDGLGIYHSHISNIDKGVLIWYAEFIGKKIIIKFEYHSPHPDDNYREIIKRIYNNTNSFNLNTGDFLSDSKYKLIESFIFNFKNFIKINESKKYFTKRNISHT